MLEVDPILVLGGGDGGGVGDEDAEDPVGGHGEMLPFGLLFAAGLLALLLLGGAYESAVGGGGGGMI